MSDDMRQLYAWKNGATGQQSVEASPSQVYYKHFFPYDLVRDWCNKEKPERQVFCLRRGDVFVDRHHTSHTADEMQSTVTRGEIDRIDIGATVGLQGEVISQKVVFDLDANDYELVYPGEGSTVEPDGLIKEGAWLMVALSLGYLGQYLQHVYGLAPRPVYRYVFSGRRGAHLWLDGYDRDWTNLNDLKQLCNVYLPRLQTAAGVEAAYAQLNEPNFALQDWLHEVGEYARTSLARSCLWDRAEATTSYLERELSALFSEPIHAHPDFFEQRLDTIEDSIWQKAGLLLIAPRHDQNVTLGKDHLIKAPFSLHHDTQLVSIPFDPFKPENYVRDNVCLPVQHVVQKSGAVYETFLESIRLFE